MAMITKEELLERLKRDGQVDCIGIQKEFGIESFVDRVEFGKMVISMRDIIDMSNGPIIKLKGGAQNG